MFRAVVKLSKDDATTVLGCYACPKDASMCLPVQGGVSKHPKELHRNRAALIAKTCDGQSPNRRNTANGFRWRWALPDDLVHVAKKKSMPWPKRGAGNANQIEVVQETLGSFEIAHVPAESWSGHAKLLRCPH